MGVTSGKAIGMLDRKGFDGHIRQPARCVGCRAAVTLYIFEQPRAPIAVRSVPWMCPYCRISNHTDASGRLTLVSRGYPDPDTDQPPELDDPTWRDCPTCEHFTGRLIGPTSHSALVNYFRCRHCGWIWTEPKPPAG